MPKALSTAEAAAIFAFLASGGLVAVYKPGARALPPTYRDTDSRKPRFYCVHAPVAFHTGDF